MTTRDEALAAMKRMTSQPKGYSIQQYALDHRTVIDALNLIPETVEEPPYRCAQCRERYSDPQAHVCHGFKGWEDEEKIVTDAEAHDFHTEQTGLY